jgi:hypothetical protein
LRTFEQAKTEKEKASKKKAFLIKRNRAFERNERLEREAQASLTESETNTLFSALLPPNLRDLTQHFLLVLFLLLFLISFTLT